MGMAGPPPTASLAGCSRTRRRGGDESKCNFHGASRKLCSAMSDDNLVPADPNDVAAALAFALRYAGRKRVRTADAIMAEIVAKRLVEHLERSGFVVIEASGDRRRGRGRARVWYSQIAL